MLLEGGLGADGVEVHEPGLEEGSGHFLEGLVHATVQLDLVVQGAEDVGDGALFGEGRDANVRLVKMIAIQTYGTAALFE